MTEPERRDPPAPVLRGAPEHGLLLSVGADGFARLTFDLPNEKVNKLTTPVMEAFERILEELGRLGLPSRVRFVRGLLIGSAKPGTFIAGADIAEIDGIADPIVGMEKARTGQKIFDQLERLPFPVVCAVGGACVGGGYELALSCTRIVASDDPAVQVGLPEVRLGIIPGFGGTQRLPRRAGLRAALDVILAGKTLDARRALSAGLVDAVVPAVLLEQEALKELVRLAETNGARWRARGGGSGGLLSARAGGSGRAGSAARRSLTGRMTSLLLDGNPLGRSLVASRARKALAARVDAAQYPAPYRALESVMAGYRLPREKAYENEARIAGEMIVTAVSKNLIFLFNAQNAAKKEAAGGTGQIRASSAGAGALRGPSGALGGPSLPVLGARAKPVPGSAIEKVGILGAGVMGAGIAQVVADAGIPVRMKDVSWDAIGRGIGSIAAGLRARLTRHRNSRRGLEKTLARVSPTIDWSGFSTCDLVIEAVLERLDVKRQVLSEAEAVMRPDAIFATNTSSLLVGEIAARAYRPGRVVGLHFFNPASKMPLVEVVAAARTEAGVVAAAAAFAARIGKVPVVVRDGPGFLVNRLLMPYLGEAVVLAEMGADIGGIDGACVAWGLPMGPFRLLDEIGLDVARHAAEGLAAAFPARAAPSNRSLERMVAAGRLGVKSGAGFYRHPRGGRAGTIDLDVARIMRGDVARFKEAGVPEQAPPGSSARGSTLDAKGATWSIPSGDELMDLLILPIVNEAAQCLADGIVRSARDVDLAMVMGAGFPPFRGGPLRYADSLGAGEVCRRLDRLASRLGPRLAPVTPLRDLARDGRRFHRT